MRHKYSDKPVQFFYIQRNADNHLLHGITVSDSKFLTSFPVWKPPRSFDWARPVRHRRQRGGAQGCLIGKR